MNHRVVRARFPVKVAWLMLFSFQVIQYFIGRSGIVVSDSVYAAEVMIFVFFTLFSTRAVKGVFASLFFLFSASFYLFICGRFIAIFLGYDSGEGAFDLNWMTSYVASQDIRGSSFLYLSSFICLYNIGYFLFVFERNYETDDREVNIYIVSLLIIVFSLLQIYSGLSAVVSAFKGGYESIYAAQAGEYSAGAATISILFYVSISLAFTTKSSLTRRVAIVLLIASSIISLIAGTRGGFISVLMLLVWLYGRNNSISARKIATIFVLMGLVLEVVMQFSARTSGHDDLNIAEIPLYFVYSQGVSLGVFAFSQTVSAFPLTAYIQSLMPGALFILKSFSGAVELHNANFLNYLSWTASPSGYAAGFGLGWTLLSDLYVYSFGFFPVFAIFSLLCGLGVRWLDDRGRMSGVWTAVCVGLSLKLFMLPRSSISTVFSFLVYFYILYMIVRILGRRSG
ncbi:O-antigen polysaccharide polymerase Wzy [Paraburkholderia flagellata]|uniref:O-antigen polysaccharide polymerase Wzy n=1 Tax=Paraburkholderia flagellata TaxID=2883241 RepID=UPI001F286DF1|nr:O-antigen polysaccharide polymerase Wzy [Paraburkholderia flagellata]